MTAVGGYVKSATDAVQQTPELLPLMGKMLEWAVRQFPISRDLEGAIASAVADLEKSAKAKAGQPPAPDPEMAKVQGAMALQKADQDGKMQLEQHRMQNDQQLAQQLAATPLVGQRLVQLFGPQQAEFDQHGAQGLGFEGRQHGRFSRGRVSQCGALCLVDQ